MKIDTIEIGKRIKECRLLRDMTQDDLGKRLNFNKSTIQRYESGSIKKIKLPVLQAIAEALNVSPDYLALTSDEPGRYMYNSNFLKFEPTPVSSPNFNYVDFHPTHRIPVLGRISAGLPLYADEHIEKYIYTELNGGSEYFGLRVVGDSMTAARICDGDIIIVRQQATVEDGEIAVVMVNSDDATVKRFHRSGRTVTLSPQSYNPAHQPQIYDLRETSIRIIGKVVQVIYQLEN